MAPAAQMVSYMSGDHQLAGYLARPEGAGPFPAVVVIHEIFGLNENIKDIARRFANEGYVALAVDLFAGRNRAICMFRFLAVSFTNSLNHIGIHDLKNTLTYLSQQPGVDANRLGAIGFCMGGGYAIAWACTDDRLKAIAPYYGVNPRPLEAVARSCPVVGSYPEKDFTAGMGKRLDAELDKHQIEHDIKVYPDAKHSFFNDLGPNHNEAASKDAWARVMAFFKAKI